MKPIVYSTIAALLIFGGLILLLFVGKDDRGLGPSGAGGPEPRTGRADPDASGGSSGVASSGSSSASTKDPASTSPAASSGPSFEDSQEPEDLAPPPLETGKAAMVFQVEDALGQPVVDAVVTVLAGRRRSSGTTDGTGTVSFEGIQGGTYTYRVGVAGYPDLVSAREVTVSEGEAKLVYLVLGSYQLVLAGHVKFSDGTPVVGVTVTAREQLTDAGEDTLVRADRLSLRAVTDAQGYYEIGGLAEGDYVVSIEGSPGLSDVRKLFRAGNRSADLHVEAVRELLVFGTVMTPDRAPLQDALVVPTGQASGQAKSDAQGRYEIPLELSDPQRVYVLNASREGYRQARVYVRADEVKSQESWELDIILQPLGARTSVVGLIQTADGVPVPGETVYLQSTSLNARYQAVSLDDGTFEIPDVQVGSDYRLLVYPRRPLDESWLRDHSRSPVVVREEGLDLTIILERIGSAALSGRMVDTAGRPIPRFTLWLRSLYALSNSVSITSEPDGSYRAEGVPEGPIHLETRSAPNFTVRGVVLKAGEETEADLVLDWGRHVLRGVVVDDSGAAVAGAEVSLRWEFDKEGTKSTSTRSTITNEVGQFSFSELGGGVHTVVVLKPEFRQAQVPHDVGTDPAELQIQLAPAAGK